MRLLVALLCFLVGLSAAAPKKTEAQIKEQKNALKKLESDLAKKREELVMLETEEKGVLNTISLLDQNLNQTRIYINELSKNETMVQRAVEQLAHDIDSLVQKIHVRREAMKVRIRKLYVSGRYSDAEVLFQLLTREGSPQREAYWVHHVLNEDRVQVETLAAMMAERDDMKRQEEEHLADLSRLREKKAREEKGLVTQMGNQEQMLLSLKHDKAMQQRALQEFERNQKLMLTLSRSWKKNASARSRRRVRRRKPARPRRPAARSRRNRKRRRLSKSRKRLSRARSRGRSACRLKETSSASMACRNIRCSTS